MTRPALLLTLSALLSASLLSLWVASGPRGDPPSREKRGTGLAKLRDEVFVFQSAGHHSGRSRVMSLRGQSEVRLRRGLTLVGLLPDGPPIKLAHVDTCDRASPAKDTAPAVERFADVIEASGNAFWAHAVLSHDSMVCGDSRGLSRLMDGLGLNRWPEVGFRQPYVAVMTANGADEHLGKPSQVLTVWGERLPGRGADTTQGRRESLPRVAHAGGGIDGHAYTNSLDALSHNEHRYSLFEIDLSWTSDDELVCIHDWASHFKSTFDLPPGGPVPLEEFERLVKSRSKFRQCTLDSLAAWLRDNPGNRIVTDIKSRNVEGLERIAQRFPSLQHRFLPQVHRPEEYFAARRLGYSDIIWTLYEYPGGDDEVLAVLNALDLFGLTMTKRHAERGLAQRAKRQRGLLSWVHTVNSLEEVARFEQLGVNNVYSDWLEDSASSVTDASAATGN